MAIGLVLLYHAGFSFVPGGYVGVDVFFVISGFLITGLLLGELERAGKISFARFYARRMRRLLPISALVLVVTALASWLILPPLRWAATATDIAAAALWGSNIRFAAAQTDYLTASDAPSVVLHYWSLGVEEQYYVVWPVLLVAVFAVLRRVGISARATVALLSSVTIAASLALAVTWTETLQPYAFFLLPARAWELAAGGLLAVAYPLLAKVPDAARNFFGLIGLVVVVAAGVLFNEATVWPGLNALVPVVGTMALIAAAGPVTRVLSMSPVRAIGRWSYSLYLWHWPMLLLTPVALGRPLTISEALLVLTAAVMLSALTYRVLELPVRVSPRLSASNRRSLILGASLVTIAALVGAVLYATPLPGTQPVTTASGTGNTSGLTYAALATAAADIKTVPADLRPSLAAAKEDTSGVDTGDCFGSITAETSPAEGCYFGDPNADTTVALIGDSHAGQWIGPLDTLLAERGLRFLILVKSACPAQPMEIQNPKYGTYPQCASWNAAVLERLRAERPAVVLVSAYAGHGVSLGGNTETYRTNAWKALFDSLSPFTTPVLLSDTPFPSDNVPECLSANMDNVAACVKSRNAMLSAPSGRIAERAAAQASGVTMIDTVELVCPSERCPVIVGNILVYRDDSHISGTFARWITPQLDDLLDPVLPAR